MSKQNEKRIYVRQEDRETDYDKLNEWQKKAFELMWVGTSQTDVALAMKKSVAWVCKFANSDIVKKIRLERTRSEYLDLAPLALSTLRSIMQKSLSDVARKDIALKVLDKIAPFEDEPKEKGGTTVNMTQNILNMSLDQIKGLKADKIRLLEEAVAERGNIPRAGGT